MGVDPNALSAIFGNPRRLRGDLRLLQRAIRSDWPIPAEAWPSLWTVLADAMAGPDHRAALRAAEILVDIERARLRGAFRSGASAG
jgi:hypothetical protein